jgi:hypothetical protein
MAEIRPLERSDLPAVATLLAGNLPVPMPEAQVPDFLARTLLDDPWSDPDLPSLVATENGDLIGFIASQVRRVRLDDRDLRGVCPSHLTVDPKRRGGAAGALLLRRLLTAGQDFTFSDTANDEVARMYKTFGGHLAHARAFDWMVVLRPLRWVRRVAATTILRSKQPREDIPVGALPFQAVRPRGGRWAFPEPEPDVIGENANAAAIVAQLPEMTRGLRLWVQYDQQFLDHLFGEIESHFGRLEQRLVRRNGQAIGWYAYVLNRSGIARILHLLTSDRDADAVLGDLVANVRGQGGAVITGRHEPHLARSLQRRLPVLGFARRPMIHCHDTEIRATLATSDSLLTQLDGEWFVT